MKVRYLTKKPATGRYVFLPDGVTVVDPDGISMSISPIEDMSRDGFVFFHSIGEYVSEKDCANGIYVEESEYYRRMEMSADDDEEEAENRDRAES